MSKIVCDYEIVFSAFRKIKQGYNVHNFIIAREEK